MASEAAVTALVSDAVARLKAAGVAAETIGARVTPRRVLGLGRSPRIVARAAAWRVGSLLLLADGTLALPGETVLTQPEGRRGHTADSARYRADLREQARLGGIAPGVVVHLDVQQLTPGVPPLPVHDGEVWFAWSPTAEPVRLADYLGERVALIVELRPSEPPRI